MPTARSVLSKKRTPKVCKRVGGISKDEKEIVAGVVMSQAGEMTTTQINGLARAMRRSPAVVKGLIEDARDQFVEKAGRYVEIHMEATEGALAEGDHEQALKGSQWALTNISGEGARIVDKPNTESGGVKVMVGIKIGGTQTPEIDK